MMKATTDTDTPTLAPHASDLMNRLRRVEGQVKGVQRMLEEGRTCSEVIQQLAAIRAAVHNASLSYMRTHAMQCLLEADSEDPLARQEMVDDLLKLISKAG
jgi:DNA-binding FrmR family transcriptional regulator